MKVPKGNALGWVETYGFIKDPFMAQCNCTLKYYDKETFDEFKTKHEETPGHELKVISP